MTAGAESGHTAQTGRTSGRRPLRALLYGDVSLNLLDGSAVWLQSAAEVFARACGHADVLLKARVQTGRLVDPIARIPGVTVVRPFEEGLARHSERGILRPPEAVAIMDRLDAEHRYDLVVVRGRALAREVATGKSALRGRLWTYLTDIPQNVADLTPEALDELTRITEHSARLLCQTEELRSFLDSAVSGAAGKCILFEPVLPPAAFDAAKPHDGPGEVVRLVYTGKYAPRWNTLEMAALPAKLAERGVTAELHMVGDKVHNEPTHPGWADRMRQALESSEGLVWHGGLSREDTFGVAAGCDLGLSWRAQELDTSLELSTKILEYGALGVPVLLNRTPMHEDLLGVDYPFFVATEADVVDAVADAVASPGRYAEARDRCTRAVEYYRVDAAVERLARHLDRAFPSAPALAGRQERLKVVVAGHDLKFFRAILDYLRSLPELEVRVDAWTGFSKHDPDRSRDLVRWADVVVAEWCGPVAIWYAKNKRPGQRLVVRLHRAELYGSWPNEVDITKVDQVVCVSPHYARLTLEKTGWPAGTVTVVPNWVDLAQLDRPKLPGARYHLGMIGIAPARKRMDLAVDVLAELRRHDERFVLFAKSKLPWDYPWVWREEAERAHFRALFDRIATSELTREAVVFDTFGSDVGAWLRRIGFVLSTSDDESFHLAPAEGMASGAVPMLLGWPGADTIYDTRWIHGSAAEMAETILSVVREDRWDAERQVAREQAAAFYPLEAVCARWVELLTHNLPASTGEGRLWSDAG